MLFAMLTWKYKKFEWMLQADQAFKDLRSRFFHALILLHSNFDQRFVVETDAFDMAIGTILL